MKTDEMLQSIVDDLKAKVEQADRILAKGATGYVVALTSEDKGGDKLFTHHRIISRDGDQVTYNFTGDALDTPYFSNTESAEKAREVLDQHWTRDRDGNDTTVYASEVLTVETALKMMRLQNLDTIEQTEAVMQK